MMKVYMDESGVHGNSPVLTVAAYMARPSQWQIWSKEWNAAKKSIKIVHAADAANFRGEFEGWTREQVAKLAERLIPINVRNLDCGVAVGIHMDEFRKAFAERETLSKLFGTPYTACFQWVIQCIFNLGAPLSECRRIEFVHERNAYENEAKESFDWVKSSRIRQGSDVKFRFGDKATFVRLQAADILAYEANKRFRNPDNKERRAWTELKQNVVALHYGRNNIGEMISRLEKIRDDRNSEIDLGSGITRAFGSRGP